MPPNGSGWRPERYKRFVRVFASALRTALVETDQGYGYLKGLGNPEGPHALACELVGTSLAHWLGLPTLDYAILNVDIDDEIPTGDKERVAAGPAFITRREGLAFPWGGDSETLANLSNIAAVSQLVIMDTWVRNCDRYAPDGMRRNWDNVLLLKEPASRRAVRLVAMDFTHAFTCGNELTKKLANIDYVKDTRVYGLFPEFRHWMDRRTVQDCATRLASVTSADINEIVGNVPDEWAMTRELRAALAGHILGRSQFLAEHVEDMIWTQMNLALETENGN